jgi:uncharacterized protein (TIGR02147 family)
MKAQNAIQKLLRDKFDEARNKNSRFSLRAFSARTGVSPGALSEILEGERRVSVELARRITERLYLDPQDRSELLKLFPDKRPYKKRKNSDVTENLQLTKDQVDPNYLKLTAARYHIIADWEHFAILSLMRTRNFKADPIWIGKRLGIVAKAAEAALDRLISVGMIEKDEDGKLRRTNTRFRTEDDQINYSLQRSHLRTLELAEESLKRETVDQRDFTAVTLAIHPKKISMAKELIRKFQDEFCEQVESEEPTEVFRLSMQLFPLTRLRSEGDES